MKKQLYKINNLIIYLRDIRPIYRRSVFLIIDLLLIFISLSIVNYFIESNLESSTKYITRLIFLAISMYVLTGQYKGISRYVGSSIFYSITIRNTIIKNMSGIGILGQGANIHAENTVISKCGQYAVACNIGGAYNFTHCTFANYWSYNSRKTPSILLNTYYEGTDGNIYVRDLGEANFTNCIIEGSLSFFNGAM